MKQTLMSLALAFLLLTAFGCGSTEDPIDPTPDVKDEMLTGAIQGEVEAIEDVSVQVRLLKGEQLVEQIEADGSYEFDELEAGDYTLRISAKGYQETEKNVTVVAGDTVSVEKITLTALAEPVSHIRGVLTDANTGEPLANVIVQLTDKTGEKSEVLTTKDGVFTFENLPVDQPLTLTVMYTCYQDHVVEVKPIPADQTFEQDIELTAAPEPEKLSPSEGLATCSQAPDFELPDGKNDKHSLSDYIGKKNVVIVFYRGSF